MDTEHTVKQTRADDGTYTVTCSCDWSASFKSTAERAAALDSYLSHKNNN